MPLTTISGEIQAQPLNDNFSFLNGRINDNFISVKDYGATGDGATDDTSAIQTALNVGLAILFPPGTYRTTATLDIAQGQYVYGMGESLTKIIANFNGGPVMRYGHSNPFTLKDLYIGRDVVAIAGDNGIEIGFVSTWTGRGLVENLHIINQWIGFKWKGGSFNVFSNIICESNLSNGFYGLNPRGNLINCLSIYNYGSGYDIFQDGTGDSGLIFDDCGTFANQNWGWVIEASNPTIFCGNYYFTNCTSSTDGRGGFVNTTPATQIYINQFFIESSGYAYNFNPLFTIYPTAKGMEFFDYVDNSMINNLTISNCKGNAFTISPNSRDINITNLNVWGNGGSLTASNQSGLVMTGPTTNIVINGFRADTDGAVNNCQLAGFAINDSSVGVLLLNGITDNYYFNGGPSAKIINIDGYNLSKVQAGTSSIIITAGGTAATAVVNFPLQFATAPTITVGITTITGDAGYNNIRASTITTASVTFTGNSYLAQTIGFAWEAIGT